MPRVALSVIDAMKIFHALKTAKLIPHFLYMYKTVAIDMPSDAQRIQKVKTLVEAGYAHRVMLAHDIHTNHRLVRDNYGFLTAQEELCVPVRHLG